MPKDHELPLLSETQLEIMNVVWDHEMCSVADVWKILNDRRGVTRNTVHTLIVRLEEKGWLTHREEGSAFVYSATVSREAARERCVQRIIETVFDGSAEGLVLTLLGGGVVSKPEAERIRDMIALAKAKETAKSKEPAKRRKS